MIYFTLNGVETKSGKVGMVTNESKTSFSSRISRWSREVVAEPIKPPGLRGVMLQTCHVAQPEVDACAAVSSRGAGCRVAHRFSVAIAGLG